jgi:hypothetical protein
MSTIKKYLAIIIIITLSSCRPISSQLSNFRILYTSNGYPICYGCDSTFNPSCYVWEVNFKDPYANDSSKINWIALQANPEVMYEDSTFILIRNNKNRYEYLVKENFPKGSKGNLSEKQVVSRIKRRSGDIKLLDELEWQSISTPR